MHHFYSLSAPPCYNHESRPDEPNSPQVKSAFGSGSGMGASGGSDFGLYGSGAGRGDSLRNMNTWMPTSM